MFAFLLQLENEERQRIEDIKEAERQKATEDFERWKVEQLAAEKEREEAQGKSQNTNSVTGPYSG